MQTLGLKAGHVSCTSAGDVSCTSAGVCVIVDLQPPSQRICNPRRRFATPVDLQPPYYIKNPRPNGRGNRGRSPTPTNGPPHATSTVSSHLSHQDTALQKFHNRVRQVAHLLQFHVRHGANDIARCTTKSRTRCRGTHRGSGSRSQYGFRRESGPPPRTPLIDRPQERSAWRRTGLRRVCVIVNVALDVSCTSAGVCVIVDQTMKLLVEVVKGSADQKLEGAMGTLFSYTRKPNATIVEHTTKIKALRKEVNEVLAAEAAADGGGAPTLLEEPGTVAIPEAMPDKFWGCVSSSICHESCVVEFFLPQ